MKINRVIVASALALSGLLAAAQAAAQAFVGGSIGQSDMDVSTTEGLITSVTAFDGKDTAFKVFGGYMFNQYFGVEGAYVNLGEATYSGTFFGLPATGGKLEVTGFNIAAVGSYPVTPEFSVFGKIGLFVWDAEASDSLGTATSDGSDISFGVGVGYNFTRNLGVRAEWERFKVVNDADADLLSIGMLWRF